MKVTVVIAVYNEIGVIANCLRSLNQQTITPEIIVVDDGSTDGSEKFAILSQKHQGPGAARNLGANKATGNILVFVDADMEFEPDFLEKLVAPIVSGQAIGTFSKEEYLLNKEKPLARCWNLNFGRKPVTMEPRDFDQPKLRWYLWGKTLLEKIEGKRAKTLFLENKSHVFRAILKKEFNRAGGFDLNAGYTDDWTLSEKLGVLANVAPGAKYYHRNPDSLPEIWVQARWFGRNGFLTKNSIRRSYNLLRYCPVLAILKGTIGAIRFREPVYFLFKVVFDTAVTTSVFMSFFGERKSR